MPTAPLDPATRPLTVDEALAAARDEGLKRLAEIARREAPNVEIAEADCLSYLRDHLEFRIGHRQRQGLEHFFALAGHHGLAPAEVKLAMLRNSR